MSEIIEISKTKRKEQMNDLQDLGIELVGLSKDKLKQLNLPDYLLEAVLEAQKLRANGAIRRQYQYIGKLMRKESDYEELRKKIDYVNGDSLLHKQIFHLTESWRDKLLADDKLITDFINLFPSAESGELHSLLRLVKKELLLEQNKNYTKLFRLIKSYIEEAML